MKIRKIALMGGVAAIAMAATAAQSADTEGAYKPLVLAQNLPQQSPGGADLPARVQALEDALAARDERAQADRTRLSTLEQQYNYASWTYDNGRPTIQTGDGRFTMSLRTRFQTDFAGFSQDQQSASFGGPRDLASGLGVRRAYLGIEGKAYNDFAYEFRLNLGGSGVEGVELSKAVVHYIGIPNWHFSFGIIEPAFQLEGTTSSGNLMFLERPEIVNIGADIFGGNDARRGAEVGWAKADVFWPGDAVNATVYFTGGKSHNSAGHGNGGDEQAQVLFRLGNRVWSSGLSNLAWGLSYAHAFNSGTDAGGGAPTMNLQDRPQIRVDGTRLISTGAISAQTGDLLSFDLAGNYENFYLGGEWTQFTVDRRCGTAAAPFTGGVCAGLPFTAIAEHPTFEGWYVHASWILTGETRPYTVAALNNEIGGFQQPVPSRPFSLRGESWGAWELVARYSDIDLDWNPRRVASATQLAGIVGGRERILDIGINWYMNRNVKLQVHNSFVKVDKGTAALPTRDSQDLNIVGVRLQFAN
ncbi:MAG TPA: porin [Rhizomicrobium sp.]|nr:porin [Rhizomicrobium sp.]